VGDESLNVNVSDYLFLVPIHSCLHINACTYVLSLKSQQLCRISAA